MVFWDFLVGKQSETCPKIASVISIWHIVFSAMQIINNVTKVSQYPRATVFLNAKSHNHWSGCLHWLAVIPRSRCFLHSCIYPKKWMCRHPNSFSFLCYCASMCKNRDRWSWRFGLHGSSWGWDDCVCHTISLCTKGTVTWNQGVCMCVCVLVCLRVWERR